MAALSIFTLCTAPQITVEMQHTPGTPETDETLTMTFMCGDRKLGVFVTFPRNPYKTRLIVGPDSEVFVNLTFQEAIDRIQREVWIPEF